MKHKFVLAVLLLCFFSCRQQNKSQRHPIYQSIRSDSALYFYELGWKQIMDEGNYGAAEESYRKVLEQDPNFLIGKNVLGRLTLNTQERIKIESDTEDLKTGIKGDERLVLDVYAALVAYTNARELKSADLSSIRKKAFEIAEQNLRKIVHKYPDEIYMKAEYIEFLNAVHGAQTALDSLDILTSEVQKNNPFLLGYAAILQAETGNFKQALEKADVLTSLIEDERAPKPYAILAAIYLKMDSLPLAKYNADKAYDLDPRNLDASRLKTTIDRLINSR